MTTQSVFTLFEAEVLPGLERLAAADLKARVGHANQKLSINRGAVTFTYTGALARLSTLKIATAVYGSLVVPVPRPKALLGHQYFKQMVAACRLAMDDKAASFATIGLDAAGDDSNVMQRLLQELGDALGLEATDDRGDLNLRIRRPRSGIGWEVLVRLNPRPLATRDWRVVNYRGALFAPIAYAMAALSQPQPTDQILNLCCGSASLMIERAAVGPYSAMFGCDLSTEALDAARANLSAAGTTTSLVCTDVRTLPYSGDSFDVLLADLPFGQLVGSHEDNLTLYPRVLSEAARVSRAGARFVVITHEKRLMARLLSEQSAWQVEQTLSINQNGLHPEISVLRRAD
ncbi:MAG: methyltransferase domain-containing protein [Anaerolineae bacterium]|nr:methyltransferase domain-containing protein [Anaerolineae bacterium]